MMNYVVTFYIASDEYYAVLISTEKCSADAVRKALRYYKKAYTGEPNNEILNIKIETLTEEEAEKWRMRGR